MTPPNSSVHRSWEVAKTLGEAALIVIVVIFLFLGNLRSTIIPIVTIPLSMIGVMIFLLAMNYSINLLTLLALVLAIGLVVDDAIVVVENIWRHIEEGLTPYRCGARRRTRNRGTRHRHDDHAGGGLCTNWIRIGPHRCACSANSPSRSQAPSSCRALSRSLCRR